MNDNSAETTAARQRKFPTNAAPTNTTTKTTSSSNSNGYSVEQETLSQRILAISSYYDILGVTKQDNFDTIKRQYKKMALQLHPDKNSAPSAEEAFKKVSRSFQCLTDPERRKVYDQYGTEDEPSSTGVSARHYENDVMTPEELFQAFFGMDISVGGGFHRARVYRRQQQRQPSQQSPNENQQRLYGLIQLVLVFLLFTATFLSNFFPSPQRRASYSLQQTMEYSVPRLSQRYDILYYVTKEFDAVLQGNREKLRSFEDDLELGFFTKRCEQEEMQILRKIKMAEYYSAASIEEIRRLSASERPSCAKMKDLRNIVGQRQLHF